RSWLVASIEWNFNSVTCNMFNDRNNAMETLQQTRPQKAGQILNQLLSVLSLSLYDDLSASDPHFRLVRNFKIKPNSQLY
ncbi:putative ankyrin repeat protein L91, partial [Trichinella spiralis]|uniref:putative ankyrin repeat protein L91 n=1 Tax=Trichinella spiralis TaxID=6334 RepID=UPI0001EFE0B3